MIFFLIGYFPTIMIVNFIKKIKLRFVSPFPNLKMTPNGIVINTQSRHKIFVGGAKMVEVNGIYFLRNSNKLVALKNVKNVVLKKGYLFFCGCGNVRLCFNCKKLYKQFNIKIISSQFDFEFYKQKALNEIMLNPFFNLKNAETKHYFKILRDILKIEIGENSVKVSKNLYNFKFTLVYKVRNVIKKIDVT